MIIQADAQMVIMSSFTTPTLCGGQAATNNNAILQATSASLLKSEAEVDVTNSKSSEDRDLEGVPQSVNREINLVFPIKEAKSAVAILFAVTWTKSCVYRLTSTGEDVPCESKTVLSLPSWSWLQWITSH
jgi:hypothetical protein